MLLALYHSESHSLSQGILTDCILEYILGLEDIKNQLESSLGREVVERQIRHKRASESESISEQDMK